VRDPAKLLIFTMACTIRCTPAKAQEKCHNVEHGKPLVFGENHEFGLVQQGFGLKVVEIGKTAIP
jgi:hypothetical protein